MLLDGICRATKWIGPSGGRVKLYCDLPKRHRGNHMQSNADLVWHDDTGPLIGTPAEDRTPEKQPPKDSSLEYF